MRSQFQRRQCAHSQDHEQEMSPTLLVLLLAPSNIAVLNAAGKRFPTSHRILWKNDQRRYTVTLNNLEWVNEGFELLLLALKCSQINNRRPVVLALAARYHAQRTTHGCRIGTHRAAVRTAWCNTDARTHARFLNNNHPQLGTANRLWEKKRIGFCSTFPI